MVYVTEKLLLLLAKRIFLNFAPPKHNSMQACIDTFEIISSTSHVEWWKYLLATCIQTVSEFQAYFFLQS